MNQPSKNIIPWLIAGIAVLAVIAIACIACGGVAVLTYFRNVPVIGTEQPALVVTQVDGVPVYPTEISEAPTTAPVEPSPTPEPVVEASPTPEQPTEAPTQEPTALPPNLNAIDFSGVTFAYDKSIASDVQPSIIEARSGTDTPPWDQSPQQKSFEFTGYSVTGANLTPRIAIYPVQEYVDLNPDVSDSVESLQQLLNDRQTTDLPDSLPFLPTWNAGQVMYAKAKFLDFKSGSGIRYVTQYAQGVVPVSSGAIFYTFQGLSQDGNWWVSAVLPLSNPILPDPSTITLDQNFMSNFKTYVADVKEQLNNQPDNSYQPDLALLDAIFESLELK